MTKIWGKVNPQGREVLKQTDAVQRNLRARGKEPMSEKQTRKIVDKLVTPVDVDKKKK